jgi:hypothetical protein
VVAGLAASQRPELIDRLVLFGLIARRNEAPAPDAAPAELFDSLTASSLRRDVKLGCGTHLMHLESARHALYREAAYREAATFLLAGDRPVYG